MIDGNKRSKAGLVIGLGLLGVGILVAIDTAAMDVATMHAKVGPKAFPFVVALGLSAIGVHILLQWAKDSTGAPHAENVRADWRSLASSSAGLLFAATFMNQLGFIVCAIVVFLLVARSFGSNRLIRDLVAATLLACVTYFGFTQLLNLQLPFGSLWNVT